METTPGSYEGVITDFGPLGVFRAQFRGFRAVDMTGLAAVPGAAVLPLSHSRISPSITRTQFPTFLSAVNVLVFVQPLGDPRKQVQDR